MANTLITPSAKIINIRTGKPLAQAFINDPDLYAFACEEGCDDMNDVDIDDMMMYVEWKLSQEE